MPTPTPDPFEDGTLGILLAPQDAQAWSDSLVLAFEMVQPPTMQGVALPEEELNNLSVILLPV